MTFQLSRRFNYQTALVRRGNTCLYRQYSLPEVCEYCRLRSIGPIPGRSKSLSSSEKTISQRLYLARRREWKKREVEQIDKDITTLNCILVRIRKQIKRQNQESILRQKSTKKRQRTEMTNRVRRKQKERAYYCRKISMSQQRYYYSPVWKETTQTNIKGKESPMKETQCKDVGVGTQTKVEGWKKDKNWQVQGSKERSQIEGTYDLSNFFPLIQLPVEYPPKSYLKQSRVSIQTSGPSRKKSKEFHEVARNRLLLASGRTRKRFRKVVNAVLFTIYLRTFNERMRLTRKTLLQRYVKQHLKSTLLDLKTLLLEYSAPFFQLMMDKSDFSYSYDPKDFTDLKLQKIKVVRKLVNFELQTFRTCTEHLAKTDKYAQLFYLLCKHGGYGCFHSLYTSEELKVMNISRRKGYISADCHLEKSAILSFLFIKMLLFNIIFSSSRIPIQSPIKRHTFTSNIVLVGNVIYQLLIDVQDQLLQRCPAVYQLGNWVRLKNIYNFKLAENMTVKEGLYQSNELISGLMNRNLVTQIYGTSQMLSAKNSIKNSLESIHESIRKYHLKIREKCFIN